MTLPRKLISCLLALALLGSMTACGIAGSAQSQTTEENMDFME